MFKDILAIILGPAFFRLGSIFGQALSLHEAEERGTTLTPYLFKNSCIHHELADHPFSFLA